MALHSSSRTQLTQQPAEKSGSPLGKLKKMFSGSTTPPEKSKKTPAMKTRETTTRLSWPTEHPENSGSPATTTSSVAMTGATSDAIFPPLSSSQASLPTPLDGRQSLQTPLSSPSTHSSTATLTPAAAPVSVLAIAFPPARPVGITAPAANARVSHLPAQESPISVPQSAPLSSPRATTSDTRTPIPTTEEISSIIDGKPLGYDEAQQLFSILEKNIERLLWHPSPSNLRQLGDTMKQITASGLDFTDIDASSLVLRMLVDPGKHNLDKVIDWIARLGCPLVSGIRKFGLNRSSVLEKAIDRGWPLTANAIADQLRQEKTLRDHTENMLARAMQSERPISFLRKALQFSSDCCPLENGIAVRMIAILAKDWQNEPDNGLHGEKFIMLFNEALKQHLTTLPIATMLQVATRFHHAPMALTMLQLNANTAYLDEDGKTVTDLAIDAQQALIEKIKRLFAKKNEVDPTSYQTKMSKYKKLLQSNQLILEALDAKTGASSSS